MEAEVIWQLILSALLGVLIGLEREYKRKSAGLRTFTLVCLGSCVFGILAQELFGGQRGDPTRVVQAIATGIGFLGGGMIFRTKKMIVGLTTASVLWISAAIGLAVGLKFYLVAILSTILTILVLVGFSYVEKRFLESKQENL